MGYLVRTAHWQFCGLVLAVLGLILTAVTSGVDNWRVWYVDDVSVITSGMALIGIWRTCFHSHVLEESEFCYSINMMDSFVPPEIVAAQVLCMVAIAVGVAANLTAGYAVRRAYFDIDGGHIRLFFLSAGTLYLMTATGLLVPVFWNMSSVLGNRTISFPPEFLLPPAPYKQDLGLGIISGAGSSILLIISGLIFLSYRPPSKAQRLKARAVGTDERGQGINGTEGSLDAESKRQGKDNAAFKAEEHL